MKLVVEEPESEALLAAIDGCGPHVTSVVGEIETARICRRAEIPDVQIEALRNGLVLIAVDEQARALAAAADPPTLRTLAAIHLATALALRDDLEAVVSYDAQLSRAAEAAGLSVISPT